MFFDNDFNERLLAFARNIAALLLVGGFALLILYRADTKAEVFQIMDEIVEKWG